MNTAGTPPDSIQVTPLVALDALTDLKYTDREATTAGVFNTNGENFNVDIGVTITTAKAPGASFTFNTAGLGAPQEDVFLYQGSVDGSPNDGGTNTGILTGTLIWGFQITDVVTADATFSAQWSDPPTADISALPTSLGTPNNKDNVVIGSGTSTNFAYDVSKGTSGTKAQLQALITNPANWIAGTNANPVTCPTSFTVIPDDVDSGSGTDTATASDSSTGAGGAGGSDSGAGGVVGTNDSGAGGTTDSGTTPDAPVTDAGTGGTDGGTGAGGMTGTGGAPADAGTGGAPGTGGMTGAGGSTADAGADAKSDTGTTGGTDAKPDTGTATDAKVDTGTTGGTDAKVDTGTGTKADAGKDGGTTSTGSSGCGCSTASNSQNLSASVTLLALAGIVMTARRRRRR